MGGAKARLKKVSTSYEPVGNPRFLKGVQWCIEMRCKILGLYASPEGMQTDTKKVYTMPPIRVVMGDRTIEIISSNWG